MQREQNRTRSLPSARAITQMEQAIGWPMDYLAEPSHVLIVNVCARVASFDGDLAREIRRRNYTGEAEQWRQLNWAYCDAIADRLIDDRVMVFMPWIGQLVEQHKHNCHKLSQFRRNRQWKQCFAIVLVRHHHLFETMPDGREAMSDETAMQMIEYADQEYIEHLIRCEPRGQHGETSNTQGTAQGKTG
jgi:hypothetical protein